MKKAILLFIICLASSTVCFAQGPSESFWNDTIGITTYYPSPHGVYGTMRLYPGQEPTEGVAPGVIYYNETEDMLKFHNNTTWVNVTGGGNAGFKINTTPPDTKPACNAANRGLFWLSKTLENPAFDTVRIYSLGGCGAQYLVQYSDDFVSWIDVSTPPVPLRPVPTGVGVTWSSSVVGHHPYWRIYLAQTGIGWSAELEFYEDRNIFRPTPAMISYSGLWVSPALVSNGVMDGAWFADTSPAGSYLAVSPGQIAIDHTEVCTEYNGNYIWRQVK